MKIVERKRLYGKSGIFLMSIIPIITIIIIFLLYSNSSNSAYKEVRIPIGSTNDTLQAFLYFPKDNGKHDVVIINHGSAGGFPKVSLPAELQAEVFRNKGYMVVVPMRKGRGTSDGVSLESEVKSDDINSWAPGIESAFEDISSVIRYCKKLDNYNGKIILAGISRGGYLSVAYSAKGEYKEDVKAVVNFVGAWVAQKEDQCPIDFNLVSFEEFGKLTNKPNIWLYGKHDKFNDEVSIQNYYKAFKSSNKNTEFYFYDNVPENGHFLADYKELWKDDLKHFLDKIKN